MKLTLEQLRKMVREVAMEEADESQTSAVSEIDPDALIAWDYVFYHLGTNNTRPSLVKKKIAQFGNTPLKASNIKAMEERTGENPVELLKQYVDLYEKIQAIKQRMKKASQSIKAERESVL